MMRGCENGCCAKKGLSETSGIISFHVSVPSVAPVSRNRSSQWNEILQSPRRWVWQEELSLQLHVLHLCTNTSLRTFPSSCFQPVPSSLWWAGSTCCSGWRAFPSFSVPCFFGIFWTQMSGSSLPCGRISAMCVGRREWGARMGGTPPVAQVPRESRGATHADVTSVVVWGWGHLERAPELTLTGLSQACANGSFSDICSIA